MQKLNDIYICKMTIDDLNQVCEIEKQTFSKPWTEADFSSSIKDDNNSYLVAKINDQVVGYCGLWGVVGEGQINNVAVKSAYRNKGIGKLLLSELIKRGKLQFLSAFTLEVRESNTSAIHLYESLGFQSVGIRKDFYDEPKENAIIMWL